MIKWENCVKWYELWWYWYFRAQAHGWSANMMGITNRHLQFLMFLINFSYNIFVTCIMDMYHFPTPFVHNISHCYHKK